MRNFRQLEVWQLSIDYVQKIQGVIKNFPSEEKYIMVPQISRCVISISANIAEGCSRKTSIDFARFLEISIGSSFELETYLIIAFNSGYIKSDIYEGLIAELSVIQKRINALRESILK